MGLSCGGCCWRRKGSCLGGGRIDWRKSRWRSSKFEVRRSNEEVRRRTNAFFVVNSNFELRTFSASTRTPRNAPHPFRASDRPLARRYFGDRRKGECRELSRPPTASRKHKVPRTRLALETPDR